tara:strand:+ start:983 stop:1162 length:180 start_codon:yes stop_codon:yes gene_type:complete
MKTPVTPETVETAIDATKWIQIVTLVKENQLLTALGLFCLWQTGALLTFYSEVGGAICG